MDTSKHDREILNWADYVPQETLFWRRELWERVGGVDTSFQFAIDWDLLLRFQRAGANIVRVPYFLGCFRTHPEQKTSGEMTDSTGDREMRRIRKFVHGRTVPRSELSSHVNKFRIEAHALLIYTPWAFVVDAAASVSPVFWRRLWAVV